MKVLIAGGTGLIGTAVANTLLDQGDEVLILTRRPSRPNHVFWNPATDELDRSKLHDVEVLVTLCGAGIADKRWTSKRKKELLASRCEPLNFLWKQRDAFPILKYSVAVSGINCYGTKEAEQDFTEVDSYGSTFVDQLVEQWERAAKIFEQVVPVGILRMGIVLSADGGAVPKLLKPIRWKLGAVLGTGKQWISWIHISDVAAVFSHAIEHKLSGSYNVLAGNATNRELTEALAKRCGRKISLPNVPGFLLRLVLGKMSVLLLKGVRASPEKLKQSGFAFTYPDLKKALDALPID